MDWREVIENPSLRNLPFKIETNEWGQIVMTPATVRHSKGLYVNKATFSERNYCRSKVQQRFV